MIPEGTEVRKMDKTYWGKIPNEVLEKILLAVPTYQLPFNESWVCKKWTRIILQPRFWVQKLKRHGIIIDDYIWSVLQEFRNNEMASCLYYASLYQEHRTQQTPISKYGSSIPTDEGAVFYKPWIISEDFDTMLMASGFLVCRSHYNAYLNFKKDAKIKALTLLLKLLVARQIPLFVCDNYAFWNFSPRFNYLQILKGMSDEAEILQDFVGCLPTLEGLSSSIENITLSIGVDDQNIAIDPGLLRINRNTGLTLHLKAGTALSNLPKISSDICIEFIVSGLEESHILWMVEVTKKFLIDGDHWLIFFNYQLDLKASESLLNGMSNAGFDLDFEISCSSSTLDLDSAKILADLSFTLWPNCTDGFHWFPSGDYLIKETGILRGLYSILGTTIDGDKPYIHVNEESDDD